MRALLWCCCILFVAGPVVPGPALGQEAWVLESRAAAQRLGGRLMAELSRALADSPAAAIRVCSERAPEIAGEESGVLGASLGRTALRLRNPDNAPLGWQRRALESFTRQLAAGADPMALEFTEVATVDAGTERRWMKPIMTAPLCLTCHGPTLAADVAAAVAARYPRDEATGFAAGDLRGALYVVWRETAPE